LNFEIEVWPILPDQLKANKIVYCICGFRYTDRQAVVKIMGVLDSSTFEDFKLIPSANWMSQIVQEQFSQETIE
jgi:hypothetical protein